MNYNTYEYINTHTSEKEYAVRFDDRLRHPLDRIVAKAAQRYNVIDHFPTGYYFFRTDTDRTMFIMSLPSE